MKTNKNVIAYFNEKEEVKRIKELESFIDNNKEIEAKYNELAQHNRKDINDAIGVSVASSCLSLNKCYAVFAFTDTGGTAKRISHYRPSEPIIALAPSERTAERLSYYWGVYPIIVKRTEKFEDFDNISREVAKQIGLKKGDIVVQTSGFGVEHGQTNTVRLLEL